jgi:UDPglucose 6-dehydrogenase
MKVCVIGAGYVGLTTAAVLSQLGHDVLCIDKNKHKIETLQQGNVPVYEPKLKELIAQNVSQQRLAFTDDIGKSLQTCDVILIAVGTPTSSDGSPDLNAVQTVIENLAHVINRYKLILTKSTVPPGTNAWIEKSLHDKGVDASMFDLVSNPEFLREGSAVDDFLRPNKVVVGVKNRLIVDKVKELYKGIEAPHIVTGFEGAEMIKYASNAFLATKVSFINEIANICDAYGANVEDVAKALGTDPRIGPHFLKAGLGYGGSCLPKDIHALSHAALEKRVVPFLLESVNKINEAQIGIYAERLKDALADEDGKKITVWGMAFKPNTGDVRFSPALQLIQRLTEEGYEVHAYDPLAAPNDVRTVIHKNMYDSVKNSFALIIATDWNQFKHANWAMVKKNMKGDVVLDCRNCLKPEIIRSHGLTYTGVACR